MLPARRGAGFDDLAKCRGEKKLLAGISNNLSETTCLLGLGGFYFYESRTVLLLPVLRRAKEEGETDLAFLAS